MIEIKHVTKRYGDKKAVDDVSFKVEDGDIFAFSGIMVPAKLLLLKPL